VPAGGGGSGAASPSRERERQRGEAGEQQRRRQDVDGQVEAVRPRQRQHPLAVLLDQRLLDLRLGLALVDQRPDECPLGVRLRRFGDGEGGVAQDAHDLVFDVGQRGAGSRG
jgi:hypothetical protein